MRVRAVLYIYHVIHTMKNQISFEFCKLDLVSMMKGYLVFIPFLSSRGRP